MNNFFEKAIQSKKMRIFLFSLFLMFLIHLLISPWLLQLLAFLAVLILDTFLLYFFTTHHVKTGFFTVPQYNLFLHLILILLSGLVLYYVHSENLFFDTFIFLMIFHAGR